MDRDTCRAIPLAEFIREGRERDEFFALNPVGRSDNRTANLLVVADRTQLDAQVSTEDTLGPLSTHRRQRLAHHRPSEGGAQDVYLSGGHFHRRHGVSESAGKSRRLASNNSRLYSVALTLDK